MIYKLMLITSIVYYITIILRMERRKMSYDFKIIKSQEEAKKTFTGIKEFEEKKVKKNDTNK